MNIRGTISKFLPLIVGNPKKKIELHREARRGKLENSQQKGTLSIDAFESIPEKTDIWFTGKADTGTSAADVSYSLFMVDA